MIQSLKAWARRPENAMDIAELKIVSTGTDVAAQISAIDNMIAAGFDAIIFIAVNPTAFSGVIKRAKRAGTVLVPFDNILDTDEVVQLNEAPAPARRNQGESGGQAYGQEQRQGARSAAGCPATRWIGTARSACTWCSTRSRTSRWSR